MTNEEEATMAHRNRTGTFVLSNPTLALGPDGHPSLLAPGPYPFTVMDGDTDIATLSDPEHPEVLIARLPLGFADELRES